MGNIAIHFWASMAITMLLVGSILAIAAIAAKRGGGGEPAKMAGVSFAVAVVFMSMPYLWDFVVTVMGGTP